MEQRVGGWDGERERERRMKREKERVEERESESSSRGGLAQSSVCAKPSHTSLPPPCGAGQGRAGVRRYFRFLGKWQSGRITFNTNKPQGINDRAGVALDVFPPPAAHLKALAFTCAPPPTAPHRLPPPPVPTPNLPTPSLFSLLSPFLVPLQGRWTRRPCFFFPITH